VAEAPLNESPLIEIHNATVWRESTCVLRNFSLRIARHERVAVLGPNGSGKSTLLKTISRELRPVHNNDSWVRILGNSHWNIWELRRQLGLVSHDLQTTYSQGTRALDVVVSGFFSSIGLDDQLRSLAQPADILKAESVMASLGLQGLSKRLFGALSTGQQRRCLLARALVHNPHALILDEPTVGLDMTARFEILRHISEMTRKGISLVWVTHDLNDIPAEVTRVIVLKNGAVFADGPKSQVLRPEILSKAFDTNLRIAELDGHFLAYPAPLPET
jgi:iron complex transport system ATP-binding protein